MPSDAAVDLTDESPTDVTVASEVTPALLARLQSVRSYPCLSVLISTRPSERLDRADAERLERLRLSVVSRLRAEGLVDVEHDNVLALDRLVQAATSGPTGAGLALYAGGGIAVAVHLPLDVDDRAVVDPTFATRDLVRALHRTPRHVVLTLSTDRAALFDGAAGRLTPASNTQFPMNLQPPEGGPLSEDRLISVLRGVDLALGSYLRLHPAPVILAGPPGTVAAFRSVSRNMVRLAGTVNGSFDDADPADLARRTRPVVTRYLHSREESALDLLTERARTGRLSSGIGATWLAARSRRPEMLVVEEGYRLPARLSPDGDHVIPADDVEEPDVIDDLVDELIELVLARGGWVALARDGSLAEHEGVALTVH